MRKFKTSEDNRTNYIYYTAEGKKLVIKPGMVGDDGKAVTGEMITILHEMDDEQVDADRREEYHCPVTPMAKETMRMTATLTYATQLQTHWSRCLPPSMSRSIPKNWTGSRQHSQL